MEWGWKQGQQMYMLCSPTQQRGCAPLTEVHVCNISGRTSKELPTVPVFLGDGGLGSEVGGICLNTFCTLKFLLLCSYFFKYKNQFKCLDWGPEIEF